MDKTEAEAKADMALRTFIREVHESRHEPTIYQLKRPHTCSICGGPAVRRTDVAAPHGFENASYPLLHLHARDWQENPHEVDERL